MTTKRKASTLATMTALAALGGGTTHTDTAFAQAAASKAGEAGIEEVIVTARRKEEKLQEIPVAVTAISGEALAAKGVQNLMDLQKFVPTMRVVSSDVNPKIFFVSIRGFRGQNPRLTEDPPVGTSFAEAPLAHPFAFGDELFDIQSAQVLKGPQGTLFGRNTTGGQVIIEPNKPSPQDGFNGNVKVTVGDYNLRRVTGAVNVPLNDVAALRIAADSNQRDGYTKNVLTGQKFDEVNNQAIRVQLLLKPTKDITSNTLFAYLDEDAAPASSQLWAVYPDATRATFGAALGTTVANAYQSLLNQQQALGYRKMISAIGTNVLTGGGIDGFSPLHCAANPNEICRSGSQPKETLRAATLVNNTKVDFDGFSIKNIFGYRRMYHLIDSYGIVQGGLSLQGIQAYQINDYRQASDEFQVMGKALNDRLDWIAGAFAFLEHGEDYSPAYQGITAFANSAIAGSPQSWTANKNRNVNKSHAFFAQGDYKLADRWTATVGVRKTWDERSVDVLNKASNFAVATNTWTTVCSARNAAGTLLPASACDLHGDTNSSASTWNLSLQYKQDVDTMYYGSVRKGYKSGGFSPLVNIPQRLAFQPEYVTEAELGVKSDWSLVGMPVRTNAAYFYDWYKQEQLQVASFTPGVGFANFIDNVGKSHITGAELEFTILPTDRFEIGGFLSYVKATYDSYVSRPASGPVDLTNTEFGQNYAIPKWQGALYTSYRLPLDNGSSVRFAADLAFRAKAPTDQNVANILKYGGNFTPQIKEPGRAVLNLRADWKKFLGNPFDLGFYVTNVTDKVYVQGGSPVVGIQTVHVAEPRMFGIELSYKFGEGFKPRD